MAPSRWRATPPSARRRATPARTSSSTERMTPSPTLAPAGEPDVDDERPSFLDPISRWQQLLTPFPRAGLFYARSWPNWLQHRNDDGVPAPFPSLLLTGHALL